MQSIRNRLEDIGLETGFRPNETFYQQPLFPGEGLSRLKQTARCE